MISQYFCLLVFPEASCLWSDVCSRYLFSYPCRARHQTAPFSFHYSRLFHDLDIIQRWVKTKDEPLQQGTTLQVVETDWPRVGLHSELVYGPNTRSLFPTCTAGSTQRVLQPLPHPYSLFQHMQRDGFTPLCLAQLYLNYLYSVFWQKSL